MRALAPLMLLLIGGAAAAQRPAPPAQLVQKAHERLLPLQGGRNFRDMGGYRTRDGRQVRWRLLYRSGAMSELTGADYAYLSRLGIRSVCDLRSASERQSAPTVWKGKSDYWTSDLGQGGDMRSLFTGTGQRTPEKMQAAMTNMYRTLPVSQKHAYTHMFKELVAGRVPLVFNCTAGKDRTGVAAALILTALGVPRETVIQDYLLTNELVDLNEALSKGLLASMPPAVIAPVLRADRAYIEATFDELDKRYGSVEAYLRKELGVAPAQLRAMRARLLR